MRRLLLSLGLLRLQSRQLGVDLSLSLAQRRLVSDLRCERLAHDQQVLGHQPQAGISYLGLDDDRATRHFSLTPQRLELTSKLSGEVLQTREVDLH